jgi:hypothetical protein
MWEYLLVGGILTPFQESYRHEQPITIPTCHVAGMIVIDNLSVVNNAISEVTTGEQAKSRCLG